MWHRGLLMFPATWLVLQAQDPKGDMDDLAVLVNTRVEVASKSAERAGEAPGIISVLTRDEIRRFGGVTLADILNRVPGVVAVSSYFTDRTMMAFGGDNIRNFKTNMHVLVLIDGRPIREAQEGGIKTDVYETFPISVIDRIEVIKGPGSVLYGSEAFSGVINVVTEKGRAEGVTVCGAVGNQGAFSHQVRVNVHEDDFALVAAVQRRRAPDWRVDYGVNETPLGPTLRYLSAEVQPQSTGAYIRSRYKGFALSGAFHRYDTPYLIADYQNVGREHYRRMFLDGGYAGEVTDRWRIAANLTFNKSWLKTEAPTLPGLDRVSHEGLGEITNFITFPQDVKLVVGGLYSRASGTERTARYPFTLTSQGSRPSVAAYAQLDAPLGGELRATLGFQALKVGEAKFTTVPRAGLLWQPTTQVHLKVLYGEAFRAPYINENYIDFARYLLGNKALNPERVKSFQFGVTYVGKRGECTLSAFRNRQSDLIAYTYLQGSSGTLIYQNTGNATIHGLEAEGKYYVNRSLLLVGSVLVQRTPAGELTGWSDLGGKVGISYRGPLGVVSLFDVHQGPLDSALHNPQSLNPKPSAYDLVSLHASLDLSALLNSTSRRHFELYLQGDNLLGKELWLPATGDAWPAVLPIKPGRTVMIGFRGTF